MILDFFKRRARRLDRREPTFSGRSYAAAGGGRLTADWIASTSSGDSELNGSLTILRNRSRSLCRDNAYAKRARNVIKSNLVGTGIRMQSIRTDQNGQKRREENESLQNAWWRWANGDGCHVAGILSLQDILRLAVGEVFEAGEVILRMVPERFGSSEIPLAIEVIEAERLVNSTRIERLPNGNTIRMGVECDEWGRPEAYWLYRGHPGDGVFRGYNAQDHIRVPAEDCIHLYVCDRWPQTRGEPWMATSIRRLRDVDKYTESELVAARASASIMGFIQRPDDEAYGGDDEEDEENVFHGRPGEIWKLDPGETFNGFNPSRPNTGLEPFLRYMIREIATGVGISYEVLSRDYSKSNYSSSRLSIIDDRQAFRVLQWWLIQRFLYPLYRRWFRAASLSGVVKVHGAFSEENEWVEAVRFQPPGWQWIDPTKEIAAYVAAVKAGFMTVSDVIAQTGGDPEDTFKARQAELELMKELGIESHPISTDAPPPQPEAAGGEGSGDSPPDEDQETETIEQ